MHAMMVASIEAMRGIYIREREVLRESTGGDRLPLRTNVFLVLVRPEICTSDFWLTMKRVTSMATLLI